MVLGGSGGGTIGEQLRQHTRRAKDPQRIASGGQDSVGLRPGGEMEYQDRSSRPLLPKQAFRSAGKHNRGSILPLKMIFPGFLNRIIEIASDESSEQALSFVLAVSEFPRVRN